MERTKKNDLIGTMVYGKVPPQAADLESAVLGAIMLEKEAYSKIAHMLRPEIFYTGSNQKVYEVMQELDRKNEVIDILTVVDALQKKGWLDSIGGPAAVTRYQNAVVSSAHIVPHTRIILQKWIQREMIRISGETIGDSYEGTKDPLDVMDAIEETVHNIRNLLTGIKSVAYSEHLFRRLQAIISNDGTQPPGVQSGFPSLDKLLLCFFPGQLYIIAARPSMGKTAFLVQLLENMTFGTKFTSGVPVGFLELETAPDSFIDRHLANKTGLNSFLLKSGGLTEEQKANVQHQAQVILNQPIIADFLTEIDISLIRAKVRMWIKKYGIKALMIDYLQIIQSTEKDEKQVRERQVAKIATGLANIAIDFQIPVIAFAQLSRAVLSRGGNRPNLGDLRESGTIEQAARCIMFIHRPEYYGETDDELGNQLPKGTTEIIVAKNNEGITGTANLIMQAHLSRFIDAEEHKPGWTSVDTEFF